MNKASCILGVVAMLVGVGAGVGCGNGGTTTGSGGAASTSSTGSAAMDGGTPTCNPFTGAPCKLAMGESCDFDLDGLPHCFPPPSGAKLCEPCGVDPGDGGTADYCGVGLTCLDSNQCTAFCCKDEDCGAGGTCDKTFLGDPHVGVCAIAAAIPDGGADDAGTLPTQPACGAPDKPLSGGSCYKP